MNLRNVLLPITILFLSSNFVQRTDAVVEDVLDVIYLLKTIGSGIFETWDLVKGTNDFISTDVDLPFVREKQKKVLSRLTEISRQIRQTESYTTNAALWTIDSISYKIKSNNKLEFSLNELTDLINRIRIQDIKLQEYAVNSTLLERNTLEDYAQNIVSANDLSVGNLLERIHLRAAGTPEATSIGSEGVLELLAVDLEESSSQVCATRQSSQQVLFQLYNAISIAEIKGYAMMQFSWMLLRTYGKGNYTRESQLMRSRFEDRTTKTQRILREIMKRADRSVWRCDPVRHVAGETYEEVTRLLQGYIENEVDLNNDETCKENCAAYQFTQNYGCYKDMYCARQPQCKGKLLNCQFVDSDMWICPSSVKGLRRYEFIEYESGRVLGKKGTCTRGTTKVDSWWRWLFWHCSYCLCFCDEQGMKSDRYFNLRPTVSNTKENKVITGLRFRKVNRIIHLQIQEGVLLARGNINSSSVQWKPIDNYSLSDRQISNNIDYFTLSWDKRSMDLDDIMAPINHVVTGVRFRSIGSHINFEIRVTETDFNAGTLIEPDTTSIWVSNDQTENSSQNRRTQIKLTNPDISILTPAKSIPDSSHNQFIEFTHTDIDADIAQTTVPFLDAQDVTSIPPVALAGAGIYHKGRPNYGGFIAPKLITYDFSPYIRTPDPIETLT